MIGLLPGDEPGPSYEDLIRQRLITRRRIADCATARARLEYQSSRLPRRRPDYAAQRQEITARIDDLTQMEQTLRTQEAQLTLRIRPCER
jgi:hypothetical protein